MKISSAEFVISNTKLSECPPPKLPEYAFIGRSNVGKSSLINMLAQKKGLAKTSGKPGKTRLINHFIVNEAWYIVDLPGYGYASVSKKERESWKKFSQNYFLKRENLVNSFVLLDSRLTPQKVDLEFMEWMGMKGIPFSMVFTKIDKLSSKELNKNLQEYKKAMLQVWEELPPIFLSSATAKHGRDEILNFIEKTNELFEAVDFQ